MEQEEIIVPKSTPKMIGEVSRMQRGEPMEEELPEGAQALAPKEKTEEVEAAAAESEVPAGEPQVDEPVELYGRTFKNEAEARSYLESLESDKKTLEEERLVREAHAQGVREALEAQARAQAPVVAPPEEEDFEQKFYSNPKATLQEIQQKARDEAIQAIKAEQQKEKVWTDFLTEYPDIRRKDAERILAEQWDTLGKISDLAAGKKLLAQKVREEYEEITNLRKPRTELSAKKVAMAPSGGAPGGVTPRGKEEKPLSFAEQLRKLRG